MLVVPVIEQRWDTNTKCHGTMQQGELINTYYHYIPPWNNHSINNDSFIAHIKLCALNFNIYNRVYSEQVVIFTCNTVCTQRTKTQTDELAKASTLQALDAKSYHYCQIHSTQNQNKNSVKRRNQCMKQAESIRFDSPSHLTTMQQLKLQGV